MKKPIALSSNTLKLVACATMLVDHVGFLFFHEQLVFRIVGRMSFPLFAFLVAEGYEHTSNLRNYFFRLLGFAAISQGPYLLFRYAADGELGDLNIFFTLATGLLAILVWDTWPLASSIPAIGIIFLAVYFFSVDYTMYGVLSVLLSRLVLYYRTWGLATLIFLPQMPVIIRYLLGVISIQTFAAMSVPLIAAYNGERGRTIPKWFFYGFYPVHLLLLWAIWLLFKAF